MARIGLMLRQKWKSFRLRHARVYGMFRYDRAYNEWHINRMVAEARRKKRCIAQPVSDVTGVKSGSTP